MVDSAIEMWRVLTLLFLACALITRRHVHDSVGVDVERDLHLGHPTRRWGDPNLDGRQLVSAGIQAEVQRSRSRLLISFRCFKNNRSNCFNLSIFIDE